MNQPPGKPDEPAGDGHVWAYRDGSWHRWKVPRDPEPGEKGYRLNQVLRVVKVVAIVLVVLFVLERVQTFVASPGQPPNPDCQSMWDWPC